VELRAKGVAPADFEVIGASDWTPQQRLESVNLLRDVSLHMQGVGVPAHHPWRGVSVGAIMPMDVERLKTRIDAVIQRLDHLAVGTNALARELHAKTGDSVVDVATLARLGHRLSSAPDMDRASIAHDVWQTRRAAISKLLQAGQTFFTQQLKLTGILVESAWTVEVRQVRRHLAAHGHSWIRWFNKDYREAQATLRGLLVVKPPGPLTERLGILDSLIEGQSARWSIDVAEDNDQLGRLAFGAKWQGVESDWAALEAIDRWESECRDIKLPNVFRQVMARMGDSAAIKRLLPQIAADMKTALQEAELIFQGLGLNLQVAFGYGNLHAVPLDDLKMRFQAWQASPESLTKWILFRSRWEKLATRGMAGLAAKMYDGSVKWEQAEDILLMAYFEQIMRSAMHASSTLSEFDGQSHDRLVAMFKSRDEQRIAFARHEVALAHHATIPQGHMSIGEIGVLQREIEKKRNHLPVRKLLKQAGTTIQAIKPVFMMSPISVAQFLEPGQLTFDLLLIDEASQVNPVDALGAIARARQIVVVGDDKQLPPTRFFDKMLADGDGNGDEQDDAFSASDVESILGFCTAQGMPQRMLRWHYRSRHESLIAVSNREFYNSRLFVVPSAVRSSEHQGLSFHHVTTGVFDRGGSATNRVEAQAVAQAAMQHARTAPEKSLGIGAFSVAQRDAIRDELELLRRQDPTCEAFFSPGQPDPFFIKNLENIQGDERDVIFISVGYGPDANGNLMMNFGPLQTDGGERRLNVLISRARDRCEVFSSITDDNIDLERARSRGAQAFKTFLHYARTGVLDIGISTDRGFDSEFEAEVARAVEGHGFKVVSQVGLAGFFIDLAVVDPECPGRYLLGIECDGATYHSSRSARDRDRLRESILRSRGWIIHRIWSTDWFHRPEDQLRKTLAAIEQAKTEWATRNGAVNNHSAVVHPSAPDDQIERIAIVPSHARESSLSIPYEQATFAAPQGAVAEMPPDEVRSLVLKVVQLEGPIHIDELTRRVVELTGGGRTGKRSIETVRNVLHTASQQRLVDAEQDFYCFPGAANPLVRDRSDVSQSLRKPEMLPPAEIRAGAIQIVAANSGASPSDVVTAVSRALGFASTSAQLRAVIEQQLESLVCTGVFTQREGKLYAVKQTASHVSCS
jgi:very-short-patch-repair endonuclease